MGTVEWNSPYALVAVFTPLVGVSALAAAPFALLAPVIALLFRETALRGLPEPATTAGSTSTSSWSRPPNALRRPGPSRWTAR